MIVSPSLEQRDQRGDGGVDDSGRDHDPDGARRRRAWRRSPRARWRRSRPRTRAAATASGLRSKATQSCPSPHQTADEIGAHAAQADHSKLHRHPYVTQLGFPADGTCRHREARGRRGGRASWSRTARALGSARAPRSAFLLPALAARGLSLRCVATSVATEEQAALARPRGRAVRHARPARHRHRRRRPDRARPLGGQGRRRRAHAREDRGRGRRPLRRDRRLEQARWSAIVAADPAGDPRVTAPRRRWPALAPGGPARRCPPSPDGGLIADYRGEMGDVRALAARLSGTPGVVDHGLFAPELISDVIVARRDGKSALRGEPSCPDHL